MLLLAATLWVVMAASSDVDLVADLLLKGVTPVTVVVLMVKELLVTPGERNRLRDENAQLRQEIRELNQEIRSDILPTMIAAPRAMETFTESLKGLTVVVERLRRAR